MRYQYNDGGRAEAGYKGRTGDCVCRAIAIATGTPYQEVYDIINHYAKTTEQARRKGKRGKSSARTGVLIKSVREIITKIFGWRWVPTMKIGQGCKTHLRDGELPGGRLIVSVSGHLTAVIDGVINDTYDCSRDGTRCVYGYYTKA